MVLIAVISDLNEVIYIGRNSLHDCIVNQELAYFEDQKFDGIQDGEFDYENSIKITKQELYEYLMEFGLLKSTVSILDQIIHDEATDFLPFDRVIDTRADKTGTVRCRTKMGLFIVFDDPDYLNKHARGKDGLCKFKKTVKITPENITYIKKL